MTVCPPVKGNARVTCSMTNKWQNKFVKSCQACFTIDLTFVHDEDNRGFIKSRLYHPHYSFSTDSVPVSGFQAPWHVEAVSTQV